jgi:micrococcal nuclease
MILAGIVLLLAGCSSSEEGTENTSGPETTTEEAATTTTAKETTAEEAATKITTEETTARSQTTPEQGLNQSSYDATTTVTDVVDGDTVDISPAVEGKTRVRFIGVDAPETVDPNCGTQPYGEEASQYTKSKLTNQKVGLELDVQKTDQYNRLLAYVYPTDTEMFNETLLKEGYAQVAIFQPNVKYRDRFLAAQQEAQAAGRGLWGLSIEERAAQTDRGNGIGSAICTDEQTPDPNVPNPDLPNPNIPNPDLPKGIPDPDPPKKKQDKKNNNRGRDWFNIPFWPGD